MRRNGTKHAELLSKKWPVIRKKTVKAQRAGLVLCRYTELTKADFGDGAVYVSVFEEEIDCLLYAVDPKSVDFEKYHEADKIIGFPWCDISKDPQIDQLFVESQTGNRWRITGILSDDPLKAFVQCACTRFYDTTDIVKTGIVSFGFNLSSYNKGLIADMFFAKATTATTAQPLTDSYVEVQNTVFGPDPARMPTEKRVLVAYESSIQTVATGATGAQIMYKLQRSLEPTAGPEVWSDIPGAVADVSLVTDQDYRSTFRFTDQLVNGVPVGYKLLYRLLAMRASADLGATLHNNNITPAISVQCDIDYPLGTEYTAYATVTLSLSATTSGEVAKDGSFASDFDLTASTAGNTAKDGSFSADFDLTVSTSGNSTKEGVFAADFDLSAATSGEATKEGSFASDFDLSAVTSGSSAKDGSFASDFDLTASTAGDSAKDGSFASDFDLTATTAGGLANVEGSFAVDFDLSASTAVYQPEDVIWSAPPSDPPADELGAAWEEVLGTTVTIPGYVGGLPNVRFVYNASLSLLATGASGGLATFKLQRNENGAGWTDITGQTAQCELVAQNDEARFAIVLDDAYPVGVPANTPIQYRLMGTSTAPYTVNVHDSIIDPDNTAPNAYVQAEYFFG